MDRRVDDYVAARGEWASVLVPLLALLRSTELEETVKWGAPVFTLGGRNVVGLVAFKRYAGLWFFDGALMEDPDKVLVNAQTGKTRGQRQWRFGPEDVVDEAAVRSYVDRAIGVARSGKTLPKTAAPVAETPAELAAALSGDEALAAAFDSLTPGRRREILAYVGEAKRADTRSRRVEKVVPLIRRGEGLSDRYRK